MKLKVGMVAAVDMLALSIAVERGFLKKYGVDVTIARPYATGVVALNALQAGETDIVQASGPAIGAILRGMDLVFLGNVSGNATKAGPDASSQGSIQAGAKLPRSSRSWACSGRAFLS